MAREIRMSAATSMVDAMFRTHHPWLRSWLKRQPYLVTSPEDIASEVFLQILDLPNLADLREPRAMMATIARRVIFNLRRRNDLLNAYQADLLAAPEMLASSPEEQLVFNEALRAVDRMLETLSPKAKAAFLYSRLDGMRQETIAEELGVSVKTVGTYITQGLRRAYALKKDLL